MNFKLDKISATNLANLNASNFCGRCFWLRARMGFKNPFQLFPKIFNDLDQMQKTFTESYLKDQGVLPPWLKEWEVTSSIEVPGYGKWCAQHDSGVMISGIADHIFQLKSGKLLILDYKTSRPGGDKMFDLYKSQLSTYRFIAEKTGMGEVEQLALVYYEPMTMGTEWRNYAYPVKFGGKALPTGETPSVEYLEYKPDGLSLALRPYVMKLDPIDIGPLVTRARDIAEGELPDAYQYCTECARVMEWMDVVRFDMGTTQE